MSEDNIMPKLSIKDAWEGLSIIADSTPGDPYDGNAYFKVAFDAYSIMKDRVAEAEATAYHWQTETARMEGLRNDALALEQQQRRSKERVEAERAEIAVIALVKVLEEIKLLEPTASNAAVKANDAELSMRMRAVGVVAESLQNRQWKK